MIQQCVRRTCTRVKNIQAYVKEPEILAKSSSSNEDQAALLEDRLACIKQINTELLWKTLPSEINFFFNADKPAAQFERGTQQSGNYPCGSCGVHALHMDDFAHSSSLKWRSLDDLQTLILKGKHTKLHAHHKHNRWEHVYFWICVHEICDPLWENRPFVI